MNEAAQINIAWDIVLAPLHESYRLNASSNATHNERLTAALSAAFKVCDFKAVCQALYGDAVANLLQLLRDAGVPEEELPH